MNRQDSESSGSQRVSNSIANLQSLLFGGAQLVPLGGGDPDEAAKRLREKIEGHIQIYEISSDKCFVCETRVEAQERIQLEDTLVHVSCMFCNVCGVSLKREDFHFDPKARSFYCSEHFVGELKISDVWDDINNSLDFEIEGDDANYESQATILSQSETDMEESYSTNSNLKKILESSPEVQLDHAVLGRPIMNHRRRASKHPIEVQKTPTHKISEESEEKVAVLKNKVVDLKIGIPDAKATALMFQVSNSKYSYVFSCDNISDRAHWCNTITNSIELHKRKEEFIAAQKIDMFKVIQAQMNMEAFQESHQTFFSGNVKVMIFRKGKYSGKQVTGFARLDIDHTLRVLKPNGGKQLFQWSLIDRATRFLAEVEPDIVNVLSNPKFKTHSVSFFSSLRRVFSPTSKKMKQTRKLSYPSIKMIDSPRENLRGNNMQKNIVQKKHSSSDEAFVPVYSNASDKRLLFVENARQTTGEFEIFSVWNNESASPAPKNYAA